MAIIKPEGIDLKIVENHSSAERKIYEAFQYLDEKKTKDWVVYYSYYFKRDKNKRTSYGTFFDEHNEIDFLVLAPEVGIFVFEIKGGQISIKDGKFYSKNRRGEVHEIKSPYDQAKNHYYSVSDKIGLIKRNDGREIKFNDFLAGTLVGFPDIDRLPDAGGSSNRQDTFVSGMNLYSFIMDNAKFDKDNYRYVPTKEDVELIKKKLVGCDFEYSLSKANYIKEINLSINQLTEEQETVFAGLLDNKRCLVKGVAGTGKTVLCQYLYRYLVYEKKYTVIYFTFNKLIAESINNSLDLNENSGCYPIMEYLEELYKKSPKEKLPEDWNERKKSLFEKCYQLLVDDQQLKKYDCMIIDEAQDIDDSEETYLFFDELINGGLKDGMCYLFYDDNQKIFDGKNRKINSNDHFADGENGYRYAKFELTRNCRNGFNIQNTLDTFIEGNKNADHLLSVKNKLVNNDVHMIETSKDQCANEIFKILDDLQNSDNGVKRNQITILFNRKADENNPVFASLCRKYGNYFTEFKSGIQKELTYSTVSRFKGLENDVVIYINDNIYSRSNDHYVAISRAKVFAYIIVVK